MIHFQLAVDMLGQMIILSGARFAVSESTVDLSKPQRGDGHRALIHLSLSFTLIRKWGRKLSQSLSNHRTDIRAVGEFSRWRPKNSAHNLESSLFLLLLGVHFCASNTLEFARRRDEERISKKVPLLQILYSRGCITNLLSDCHHCHLSMSGQQPLCHQSLF